MGNGLKREDSAALKGLAILLMVFTHCYRSIDKFGQYDVIFRGFTAQDAIYFSAYGKICVSIFAFISGYGLLYGYTRKVLEQQRQQPSRWIGQHLLSTLSGYWFIAPIGYVLYGYFNSFDYTRWGDTLNQQILGILADVLGLSELFGTKSVNGAWWYMSAAIVYIFLVPVLAKMMKKYGAFWCIAIVFFIPRVLGVGFQGGNSVYSFLMAMVLGMTCCQYDFFHKVEELRMFGKKWPAKVLKFVLLLFLVIFGFVTYDQVDFNLLWEYGYAIVPFFVIWFFVEFVFKIPGISMILGFLGYHSLNIWLTHTFVRDWMGEFVFSVREFWAVPLVIIGVCIVISYLLSLLKTIIGYNWLIKKAKAWMKAERRPVIQDIQDRQVIQDPQEKAIKEEAKNLAAAQNDRD